MVIYFRAEFSWWRRAFFIEYEQILGWGGRPEAVGVSAGGFATVALTADRDPALSPVSVFAGGRGSSKPDEVCNPDQLVRAFFDFGKKSRIPMLWVYSDNDHFFGRRSRRNFSSFYHGAGKPPSSAQRRTAKMVTDCFRWEEFRLDARWWMVSWRAKILPFAPRYWPLPTPPERKCA